MNTNARKWLIVATLWASSFTLPYAPQEAAAAPPDPMEIAARTKAAGETHTAYYAAAAAHQKATQAIGDLPPKIAMGNAALQQLLAAQRNAQNDVGAAQVRVNTTTKTERYTDFEEVRRRNPQTGRMESSRERVTKERQVPKTPSERAADRENLKRAQASLQGINTQGQQTQANVAAWSKELADARKALPAVEKTLAGLRDQSLDLFDWSDRWTDAQQQALADQCDGWIAADPSDQVALVWRAALRRCLGQTASALADAEAAARIPGTFTSLATALRGTLQVESSGDTDGLRDFVAALKIRGDACIYVLRGLANCRLGRFNAAEPDFKKAAAMDKDNPEANRLLALVYAASADHRDAEKALLFAKKACEQCDFKDWTALDALAAAQAEAGQFDEAVKTIQQAADLTFADKRQQCLDRQQLYQQKKPLRLDWKS